MLFKQDDKSQVLFYRISLLIGCFLLLSMIAILVVDVFFVFLDLLFNVHLNPDCFVMPFSYFIINGLGPFVLLIALFSGLLSVGICLFKRTKKGLKLAVFAVLWPTVLIGAFFIGGKIVGEMKRYRQETYELEAGCDNFKKISDALMQYSRETGYWPDVKSWADTLMEYDQSLTKDSFRNPARGETVTGFAINGKLDGVKVDDTYPKTIVLMECECGWNESLGVSIFLDEKTRRLPSILVLFADGNVGVYTLKSQTFKIFKDGRLQFNPDHSYTPLSW